MNTLIDEIKRVVRISEVTGIIGNRGNCPWREGSDSSSFSIDESIGKWHDFVTGESGDVIDAFARMNKCSNQEAIKSLAEHYGISRQTGGGVGTGSATSAGTAETPPARASKSSLDANSLLLPVMRNALEPDTLSPIPLSEIIKSIRGGEYKVRIEEISKEPDKERRRKLKNSLPKLICEADFAYRGDASKKLQLIEDSWTGLLCLDYDQKDLGGRTGKDLKPLLKGDESCVVAFLSPSGGLKLPVHIDKGVLKARRKEIWAEYYNQVAERYDALLNAKSDPSCATLGQGCFLSYDPEILVKFDAEAIPYVKPASNSNIPCLDLKRLVPESGFLADYFRLYAGKTEVPESFLLASAVGLAAAALARNVWVSEAFKIHPNLYQILAGTSGSVRKSTAANLAKRFYSKLEKDVVAHEGEKGYAVAPNLASIEALADELRMNNLWLVADEYGLMIQKQGYMAELKSFITELFGCPAQLSSSFRKDGSKGCSGKSVVESPCLNILGCSTVEYLKLSSDHQTGGFFGRHLIWLAEASNLKLPFSVKISEEEWNAVYRKLASVSHMRGEMLYTEEARAVIAENYMKLPSDVSAAEGSQLSRISDYWKKLSMVFAASDGRMEIQRQDAQRAVDLCFWLFKNYCSLLGKMNEGEMDRKGEQLLLLLERNGGALPQSEILKALHVKISELKELESRYEGQLDVVEENAKRNGKKPKIWKLLPGAAPKRRLASPSPAKTALAPTAAVAQAPKEVPVASPAQKIATPERKSVPEFKWKPIRLGPQSKGDVNTPSLDF